MAKKKSTPSATKKATKKVAAKKVASKPAKKVAAKKTTKTAVAKSKKAQAKQSVISQPRSISEKKAAPVAFSFDDVAAIVASRKHTEKEESPKEKVAKVAPIVPKKKIIVEDAPKEKRVHAAASLADILGFNPAQKKATTLEEDDIPKKWKKYYKLLMNLSNHVRDEIDLHTSDTLKHSSRDESGSSYGNHQADAGTDEFDRDFALSLVSNEQEALHEIEEAISRIKDGSYGICEVTGQPINKERLEAVPFARFSVEGQSEYEKNKRRKIDRNVGGLFADNTDAPKITSDDDDE
jgi:RNA polymerase-binding transcription factor DksA